MGRRSTHSPEELRELILSATQDIIETGGLAEVSAREVARRIDYSPGTLYNMFENLADLVLHVEARVLTRLDQRLEHATNGCSGEEAIRRFGEAYLQFSHEQPRLWNLLFEHHMPQSVAVPAWYQEKLEKPLGRLEAELMQLSGKKDEVWARRSAQALWAGLHGVASLSTTHKVCHITIESARELLEELLCNFLEGVKARFAI